MSKEQTELQIIETGDGSHTLYDPLLDEHYHSQHGSLQESKHVFIQNGLDFIAQKQKDLMVLEIGFGTGLNALLAVLNGDGSHIMYVGLEPFPLKKEIIDRLNFSDMISDEAEEHFNRIHAISWGVWNDITGSFALKKCKTTIQEFKSEEQFDLVFFDAFAPTPQPEMWTLEIFKKVHSVMNDNAILVTYCAKGEVRRTMIEAGFTCERLPGPPGKREMLRATKNG